jgi:magnesium chelatase family protein
MSLAVVRSRALSGVQSLPVMVEAHLTGGLPSLSIVGMPETTVREAKDRVRAAILNSGFEFPERRITINLAPADLPKAGGRFDLPIALGILAASGQLPTDRLEALEFVGELALGGELRSVGGILPTSVAVADSGHGLVVPVENAVEAALVEAASIYSFNTLISLCNALPNRQSMEANQYSGDVGFRSVNNALYPDLADVRGQHRARRALEIAASGAHNLLMVGPPGTGKSMLASRLPGILPAMSLDEAMESASIASISHQGLDLDNWRLRPYRAPHHTASGVALVGGGSVPMPGEISLAHNGVLFLDELPEFTRQVLDVMREPLESGEITISRAGRQSDFPARIQLVAAMNPCPCGYDGDTLNSCRCSPDQISRYAGRVSGPLLDRIDLHLPVQRIAYSELRSDAERGETSASVRERVARAHARQIARIGKSNARMNGAEIEQFCVLTEQQHRWLEKALSRFNLSARAVHRVLKVARTIADLAEADSIAQPHLAEAMGYRPVKSQINAT